MRFLPPSSSHASDFSAFKVCDCFPSLLPGTQLKVERDRANACAEIRELMTLLKGKARLGVSAQKQRVLSHVQDEKTETERKAGFGQWHGGVAVW